MGCIGGRACDPPRMRAHTSARSSSHKQQIEHKVHTNWRSHSRVRFSNFSPPRIRATEPGSTTTVTMCEFELPRLSLRCRQSRRSLGLFVSHACECARRTAFQSVDVCLFVCVVFVCATTSFVLLLLLRRQFAIESNQIRYLYSVHIYFISTMRLSSVHEMFRMIV